MCRCLTHLQIVTTGNLLYTLGNGTAVNPRDVQWSANQWIASVCAYGKPLRALAFVGYRCNATTPRPVLCPTPTGLRSLLGVDPCAPAEPALSKYVTYNHVS